MAQCLEANQRELDTGGEVLYATSYQRYKMAHTAPILQNDRLFSDFATQLTHSRGQGTHLP